MNRSSLELLNPNNCTIILIDHQPQMFFGVESANRETIINNVVALAKAAKIFKVPTILTTVAAKTFSGPLIPQLQTVFPDQKPIDRTSMNSWEDKNFVAAVEKTKRKKLVIAALWTEVCLAFPAISAVQAGYEVYAVVDASGATTLEAHNTAIQRMIQVGVVPVTWVQVLCELQRDWARQETYEAVMNLAKEHAGAYGAGIFYAQSMIGGHGG
ncbi:hydrolase [Gammaproteobacteria bacterium SCGC AG-212-F23]|nr:hydrolase [Gammaproteobacteria bacterium SCGC AG-212-F23]